MGTLSQDEVDTIFSLGSPHSVILFDDTVHTMDEVISQIIKATGYDASKSFDIMMEAHRLGRAIVYTGHLERCEHVEFILSKIRLRTKIE